MQPGRLTARDTLYGSMVLVTSESSTLSSDFKFPNFSSFQRYTGKTGRVDVCHGAVSTCRRVRARLGIDRRGIPTKRTTQSVAISFTLFNRGSRKVLPFIKIHWFSHS
jgi:hypothetical protein